MARREMSVARYIEIKRLIDEGQSDRQIGRALQCSRRKVSEIRSGRATDPVIVKIFKGPLWAEQIDWENVKTELGYKHPLKFIWEEKAQSITTYSNFWKVFYRKFPNLQNASSVIRDFDSGERVEVDWAGGKIAWIEIKTGEIHESIIFLSCLGYSQLIFARAFSDMKSRSFLEAHRQMYEFYGGVTKVTVPDCTKTAVIKCHLYDPDLNPSYVELASHYKTAILPARPYHPKDKALVELAVKLVMRSFRWLYRKYTFTSVIEINRALLVVIDKINNKSHTRFKVSRKDRFEKFEKGALKPLPSLPFEFCDWKDAVLHPDCTLLVEGTYYSSPHIHRGKTHRVKVSENIVEIFLDMERLAVHQRDKSNHGKRVLNPEHFPENAKAYYEATPKNLLSQALFLSTELHQLIEELFKKETCGNIRIVQGFVRIAKKHINETNKQEGQKQISQSIATMRSYNRFRVPYFKELLKSNRKQIINTQEREIKRKPGNPMLRYSVSTQNSALPLSESDVLDSTKGNPPEVLLPISETIKNKGVPNGNSTI